MRAEARLGRVAKMPISQGCHSRRFFWLYICKLDSHRYLHANFQKDWPQKKTQLFLVKAVVQCFWHRLYVLSVSNAGRSGSWHSRHQKTRMSRQWRELTGPHQPCSWRFEKAVLPPSSATQDQRLRTLPQWWVKNRFDIIYWVATSMPNAIMNWYTRGCCVLDL